MLAVGQGPAQSPPAWSALGRPKLNGRSTCDLTVRSTHTVHVTWARSPSPGPGHRRGTVTVLPRGATARQRPHGGHLGPATAAGAGRLQRQSRRLAAASPPDGGGTGRAASRPARRPAGQPRSMLLRRGRRRRLGHGGLRTQLAGYSRCREATDCTGHRSRLTSGWIIASLARLTVYGALQ